MSQYNESVLENGLRIITQEDKNSPIITMGLFINAGTRYESDKNDGYAHLLEHMFLKGTKKCPDPFSFRLRVDRTGSYINALTGNEDLYLKFQTVKKGIELAFDVTSDAITSSLIDENTLESEKKAVLEEIKKAQENNEKLTYIALKQEMFSGHPLSRKILGSEESVNAATREHLLSYMKDFITPQNSALIVVGVDSHDQVEELAKRYFGAWQSEMPIIRNQNDDFKLENHYFFKKTNSSLYNLAVGFSTPKASSEKENSALRVLSNYLGYGGSSVLFQELRRKRGLVYSSSASNNPYTDLGRFTISTATSKPLETISTIAECVKNIPNTLSAELLEEIKKQTINVFLRNNSDPDKELTFLGNGFILKGRLITPENFIEGIESVQHEDVINVWKKYLQPENSLTVVLGPKDIKEELGF